MSLKSFVTIVALLVTKKAYFFVNLDSKQHKQCLIQWNVQNSNIWMHSAKENSMWVVIKELLLVLSSPLNAAIIGNHFFAATGVAAVDDANSTTAEQLAGCQCCQDCKEKS